MADILIFSNQMDINWYLFMVLIYISWIIYEEFNKWNRKNDYPYKNKSYSYHTLDMQSHLWMG